MRVALAAGILLLSSIFTLSAVHALSPPQMDRAISGTSSVTQIAKKTCESVYNRCVARCKKKDTSCQDLCLTNRNFCDLFGLMY